VAPEQARFTNVSDVRLRSPPIRRAACSNPLAALRWHWRSNQEPPAGLPSPEATESPSATTRRSSIRTLRESDWVAVSTVTRWVPGPSTSTIAWQCGRPAPRSLTSCATPSTVKPGSGVAWQIESTGSISTG
jgi:hypothetical protein